MSWYLLSVWGRHLGKCAFVSKVSELHHIRGSLVCQYLTSYFSKAWVLQERIGVHERTWQPWCQLHHLCPVHLDSLPPATPENVSPLLRIRYHALKDFPSLTRGDQYSRDLHACSETIKCPRRLSIVFGLHKKVYYFIRIWLKPSTNKLVSAYMTCGTTMNF